MNERPSSSPGSSAPVRLPNRFLLSIALLYACLCLAFCCAWLYSAYWRPELPAVELGFDTDFDHRGFQLVKSVYPASPADKAGLLPGDHIITFYGHEIPDADYLGEVWRQHKPGDTISLGIVRAGRDSALILNGIFRERQFSSNETGFEFVSNQIRNLFPVPFVLIGLAILFLRIDNPLVWLLALVFCSTAASPEFPNEQAFPLSLRPYLLAFRVISVSLLGPLYYHFICSISTPFAR